MDDSNVSALESNAINSLISLKEAASLEASVDDNGKDYENLLQERSERALSTMMAINPSVARDTLCKPTELTDDRKQEIAATTIQSYYRGYRDRCKFLELLYNQYEKDENERQKRAQEQVEEGELLVANHKLEIELDDSETVLRNKQRLFECQIITIQRAWRSYKRNQKRVNEIASLQEVKEEDNQLFPLTRQENSLLSTAQEIDLKNQLSPCLPHSGHKATLLSDSSQESSCFGSASNSPSSSPIKQRNPFNASVESSLIDTIPSYDKNVGRSSLTVAAKSVKDAHREDVRKRLAMGNSEAFFSDPFSKSSSRFTRGQNQSVEVYMNECIDELSADRGSEADDDLIARQQRLQEEATVAYMQAGPIAKRLIEVERMAEEPSQVARMLGISTFRSSGEVTLTKKRLESLSLPQLQVIFNTYQNEIERLNEELVTSLLVRDELHMQQDSLLVNIEDLQRRIEELSAQGHKTENECTSKKPVVNTPEQERSTKNFGRVIRLFRLGKT